jgi:hypothetical protein
VQVGVVGMPATPTALAPCMHSGSSRSPCDVPLLFQNFQGARVCVVAAGGLQAVRRSGHAGMRHVAPAARSVKDTGKMAGTAAEKQQPLRTCSLTLARFSTDGKAFSMAGGRH